MIRSGRPGARSAGWAGSAATLALTIAATVAALTPAAAGAQLLKIELKAGAAVGNYTDTGAGLDMVPQPSFGALLELWPTATLAGYLGFNRTSFGCEEGFCIDRDVSLTSQGLVAGARWSPRLPLGPWVRGGLAVQSLAVDATGAEESFDPGLGFEVATGIDFSVGGTFRIRPGVTYMRHDASTSLGEGHVALLALEIGAAVELASF